MKKVIFAFATLLCLGFVSCSKDCKCTTTANGEVIRTDIISEETLQKANVTCENYNEVLKMVNNYTQNAGVTYNCK